MTINSERLAQRLFWVLVGFALLLVLLDAVITYGQLSEDRYIRRLFNITREDSIPNWFSSMQFLLISLCGWLLYFQQRARFAPRWQEWGWLLVAAGFLFLSMDDGSRLHERVGAWAVEAFRDPHTLAGSLVEVNPSYTWHTVMGPLFGLGGILVIGFVYTQLQRPVLRYSFAGGVACFLVSQGMDFLEGLDSVVEALRAALDVTTYDVTHFAKSAEEFIEMLGQTLILITFIRHLGDTASEFYLTAKPGE